MSILTTAAIASALVGSINSQTQPIASAFSKTEMESTFVSQAATFRAQYGDEMVNQVYRKMEAKYGSKISATQSKELAQKALSNLKNYKLIIGDIFDDIEPVSFSELRKMPIVKGMINKYIYVLYPELRNLSPNSEYPCLPSTEYNAKRINKEWRKFIETLQKHDYTVADANAIVEEFEANESILLAEELEDVTYVETTPSEEVKEDSGITFSASYSFSHLDQCLKQYQDDIKASNDAINGWTIATVVLSFFGLGFVGTVGTGVAAGMKLFNETIPQLISLFGHVNQYEEAVLYKYRDSLVYNDFFKIAYNMKEEPNSKTDSYFGQGTCNNDNCFINAFKHTYWNAWLTYRAGEDAAKYFTDAHEYEEVKKHIANNDSKDLRKSNDMDLKNNAAGRKIGKWWSKNHNKITDLNNICSKIPSNDMQALSYTVLYAVCNGTDPKNNIYTFRGDSMNDESLRICNDNIYGLYNTHATLDNSIIASLFNEESIKLMEENIWQN